MSLSVLKNAHVALATISISGFVLRGYWMLARSDALARRWVKIAPHVIDTGLLATGVWMAWRLGVSPLTHPWFAAKLAALVVYIVAGMVALRPGRSRRVRVGALCVAICAAAYIVAVALERTPLLVH